MDNFRKYNSNQPFQKRSLDGFGKTSPQKHKRVTSEFVPSRPSLDAFSKPQSVKKATKPVARSAKASTETKPNPALFRKKIDLEIDETKSKHKKGKRPSLRKILKRTTIGFAVLLVLFGGFMGFKVWENIRKSLKGGSAGALALNKEVDPQELKGEGDGRVNILLLGKGGPGHEGGELTDSILIASIDPLAKDASLVSIPRDLWVEVPELWEMKINEAYFWGKSGAAEEGKSEEDSEKAGLAKIEETVSTYFGIPIHYHIMVNFTAFKDMVDAVGGIEIDVKKPVYDTNFAWQYGVLDVSEGLQKFDGIRALLYARTRYTSARGDFDRTERQREIILALKEKVFSLGTFTNPVKITQLLDAIGDNVRTNLSLGELTRLYEIAKDIQPTSVASIGLADPPNVLVQTGQVGDRSVVVPVAGIGNYDEIKKFIRNSLKDGFIKSEDASITVLNGSGVAGVATAKAEELEGFGYRVVEVGDAPTADYTDTVLIDRTLGVKKYTKRYLEQRLAVLATDGSGIAGLEAFTSDFVIIVGSNEVSTE